MIALPVVSLVDFAFLSFLGMKWGVRKDRVSLLLTCVKLQIFMNHCNDWSGGKGETDAEGTGVVGYRANWRKGFHIVIL
jgi:hypothetical protein